MIKINLLNNIEIWKDIQEFPDYMVSDHGRVKSFKRYKEGIILTPVKNKNGYLHLDLCKNKKPYTKTIHRLVLETFEPIEDMDKFECNHKNGNKSYNIYPNNLEWCKHKDNIRHAVKNGLIKKGEESPLFGKHTSEETRKKQSEKMKGRYLGKNNPNYGKHWSEEWKKEQSERMKGENHPRSILTEEKVIEIRIDLKEGILTQKEIGEKFGVARSTISMIKTRKIWKHLK